MILFPLKLKTPMSPNVPVCFLFTKLPKDSVASSINFKLYFLAIDRNFKISQGLPKICTAIMAEILLFFFC